MEKVNAQGLSAEEIDKIRQAFEIYDSNGTGKIDPKELKNAMLSLGFNNKNPTLYQVVVDLDTPESEKNGGISFEALIEAINEKLRASETEEEYRRIFDSIIDDSSSETITLNSLRKITKELGEDYTDEELMDLIQKSAKNKEELTFEDFCDVMNKKSFP